jgi:multidrug efflux pump subunit AcrA (membrane-fusion protein)
VDCEVVSLSMLPIHVGAGQIGPVYVKVGQSVSQGEALFALNENMASASSIDAPQQTSRARVVVAPKAGEIAFVNAREGQVLKDERVALVVATASSAPLRVALRVPVDARASVRDGQQVRIKLDAFAKDPTNTRIATIDSVSLVAMGDLAASQEELSRDFLKDASSDYLAWAAWPQRPAHAGAGAFRVMSGMRGKASIVVGKVSVARWLLAPVLGKANG